MNADFKIVAVDVRNGRIPCSTIKNEAQIKKNEVSWSAVKNNI